MHGLTRRRNLRTGKPVWAAYRHSVPTEHTLRRSTRADVVVIGAGITGALVAQRLCAIGRRPLILERRRGAMLGSTAASTALLQFELDTPLVHLARKIGKRAAGRAWLCSRAAVNELRTQAHRLGIQARLESRPSLGPAATRGDHKLSVVATMPEMTTLRVFNIFRDLSRSSGSSDGVSDGIDAPRRCMPPPR